MTSNSRTPVFLILALVAGLALAATLFFTMGSAPDGASRENLDNPRSETVDNETRTEVVAETREKKLDESTRIAAPTVSLPVVKPAETLPPAYEKALAGIVGRITEAGGAPVKGASVELLGGLLDLASADIPTLLFHPEEFNPKVEQQKVVTGTDGKFHFTRVDPRQYYLVGVNLGGAPRPQLRLVDRTPNPGEPAADLGDIALDAPLTYAGRIVDESGKAVAGARVRACGLPAMIFTAGLANLGPDTSLKVNVPQMGNFFWNVPQWVRPLFEKLPFPATTTAGDGSFKLDGVPNAQITLLIDGADLPPTSNGPIPPTKNAQKDLGDVVVNRGEELEGQVVDEKGTPIAGAEVMVGIPCPLAAKELAFLRKPVKAGPDGGFVVKGIPSKTVAILARSPETTDWSPCPDAEIAGDVVKVTIPGPRTLLVKVTDVDDKPIAARIAVAPGQTPGNVRAFSLSFLPQLTPPLKPKTLDAGGGATRVLGLRATNYKVYAEAPGFAVGFADVEIDAASAAEPEVTVKLERIQTVKVTVLGKENGASVPLEGANVFVASSQGFDKRGFMALGTAKTGIDGVAHPRGAAEGKSMVFASHPGYANHGAEVQLPETKEITVQLLVGGTIEGELWNGGKPAETPTTIVLEPRGKADVNLPKLTLSGIDGKFKFTNLTPGKYRVLAMKRFFNTDLATFNLDIFDLFDNGDNEPARVDAAVEDESICTVRLDMESKSRVASADDGSIRGRVTKNGTVLVKASISVSGPEWKRGKADENGDFDLRPLKPGQYQVEVYSTTRGWQRLHGQRVDVKTGEQVQVNIDVVTGGPVRGRVLTSDTKAGVANCWVQAFAQKEPGPKAEPGSPEIEYDYGGQLGVQTNANGEFEIEDVPIATYSFRATHDKYAPAKLDGVRVDRGSAPAPLTLVLQPGITVSGTVDAPGSEKFGWSGLSFQKINDPTVSAWTNLEKEKAFKVSSLTPGKYRVWYYGSGDEDGADGGASYEMLEVEVPAGGTSGLTLHFKKAKPQTQAIPVVEGK